MRKIDAVNERDRDWEWRKREIANSDNKQFNYKPNVTFSSGTGIGTSTLLRNHRIHIRIFYQTAAGCCSFFGAKTQQVSFENGQ